MQSSIIFNHIRSLASIGKRTLHKTSNKSQYSSIWPKGQKKASVVSYQCWLEPIFLCTCGFSRNKQECYHGQQWRINHHLAITIHCLDKQFKVLWTFHYFWPTYCDNCYSIKSLSAVGLNELSSKMCLIPGYSYKFVWVSPRFNPITSAFADCETTS